MKLSFDEMASWQYYPLMEWQVNEMTEHLKFAIFSRILILIFVSKIKMFKHRDGQNIGR